MYSDVPWDSPTLSHLPPPNSTANEEIQPRQNTECRERKREGDADRERQHEREADKQIARKRGGHAIKPNKQERTSRDGGVKGRSACSSVDGRDI